MSLFNNQGQTFAQANPYSSLGQYGQSAQLGSGMFGVSGMPGSMPSMDDGALNSLITDQMSTYGNGAFTTQMQPGANGAAMNQLVQPGAGGGGMSFLGTKDQPGWGGMALGVGQGLLGGYLGLKQYGLAKDSLAESKRQFGLNYGAQKTLTNASLEDRQKARVSFDSGSESADSYMKRNGIK